MKLFKSLLLASATGLVAVSGASAADLGAKKPTPVEYVRACYNPLWGTSGGFIIPGGQTCLRVFGQARFDIGYGQPFLRNNSLIGYRGGAMIGLDAITPSEYGNVRAFASIAVTYRSGQQNSGTQIRNGFAVAGSFPAGTGSAGQTEIMSTGFIQFAGFTMGRTASFFRTVGAPAEIIGSTMLSSPQNVNTIAYTAQLGNGFLATIALEDPTTRRFGVTGQSLVALNGNFGVPNTIPNGGFGATPGFFNGAGGFTNANVLQIGNRMPTVVASLRVDQAWGSAELSGMVNEIGIVGNLPLFNAANSAPNGLFMSPNARYGWAVNGGLKINLPMLAAGSNLTLNAVYSQGNLSAVLSNPFGNSFAALNVGGIAVVAPDMTVNQFSGGTSLTTAWGVTAGLQHFWTPTLNSTLFGSYGSVNVGNTVFSAADTLRDFTVWSVGLNTVWQPVRGLNIALEGAYLRVGVQGSMIDVNKNVLQGQNGATAFSAGCNPNAVNTLPAATCRTKSSDGAFQARFRVTRDF
jgi:Porin subfamily